MPMQNQPTNLQLLRQVARLLLPALLTIVSVVWLLSSTVFWADAGAPVPSWQSNESDYTQSVTCTTPDALDIYYMLDLSSSMGQVYLGAGNRLEAAKLAIENTNSLIEGWGNGSRVGLITFYGGTNGVGFPPTYAVTLVNQLASRPFWGGLTDDFQDFQDALDPLTANGSPPTSHAVDFSEGEMVLDNAGGRIPVMILLSDGVPTISSERLGFNDADVQAVNVRDNTDNFRPIADVQGDGAPHPDAPGFFAGEPLADVMQETDDIMAAHPNFTYHAIAIQGEDANIFNSEILEYVAFVGHGTFAAPSNLSTLQASLENAVESSACPEEPTNTPTATPTATLTAAAFTSTPLGTPTAIATPTPTPTATPMAFVGLEPVGGWFSSDSDYTRSVAWGDVDFDGDLDLAVANNGPNKLYLNQGAEGLQSAASWASDDSDDTRGVVWGDVDSDGDLDLAVANYGKQNKLYLNEEGQLSTNVSWTSAYSDTTLSLVWGDVDSDGDLDLAVANYGPNKLYLNQGGQLSTNASWTSADSDNTRSMAWGDVDSDGDLDLAVVNFGQPNKLYLNQGGQLSTNASWTSDDSDNSQSVAWGDVDSDGDFDLAVANFGQPNKLYLNQGGQLSTNASWTSDDSDNSQSVAWGDVDSDGDLDLAVANSLGPNKLYLNQSGMLSTNANWISDDSDDTQGVAWGDVDSDGDLDLAVANWLGPNKLYLNQGRMLPSAASQQSTELSDQTYNMAWGDVDLDGDLDLAVANYGNPNKLYLNEGGELQSSASWASADSDTTWSVAWGDVDSDGDLDLAVANSGKQNKLYLNQEGQLSTNVSWTSAYSDTTLSVAWGDVDSDGDLDLAVANYGPNKLYLNQGGQLFTNASWASDDSDDTWSVAWGDVDSDGDLDLAVANFGQPNKLYLNQGGQLSTNASWSSDDSDSTSSVAWGDVDSDGNLDLVVANYRSPNKLYLNQGGLLSTNASWASDDSDRTVNVAWGDVDSDGDLDLAVANFGQPNKLYLNHLTAAGGLQSVASWQSSDRDSIWSVAWGDVDSDGDLDLAIANRNGPNKLYLNQQSAHPLHPDQCESECQGTVSLSILATRASQTVPALAPANFYAVSSIHDANTIPITYTLFHPASEPMRQVRAFYSLDGGGRWLPVVATSDTITANLATTSYPTATVTNSHLFTWDVLASGFFGQSDNVVLRMEALPNLKPITDSIPGPFQRPFVSAQTYPFRVRGSQIQVLSGTVPVKDALVYRLPAGQASDAEPIANNALKPFRTDAQGYLQGRGELAIGDQLVALLPITHTDSYTLYHTNATPTESGLTGVTVSQFGVQELVVSADNPLLLFSLDFSLEWDARHDGTFLADLEEAIKHASDVLYDVSNGQVAIGEVRLHQAKENWTASNIVMYAANNIRPRANMGGVVSSSTHDYALTGPIENAYLPGQVRMGPNWDPFGENNSDLSQDWWRTLAHELAHYLLFLPDNYIGISQNGHLISLDCQGSFMTNSYDDDYSEFLTEAAWGGDCQESIAAHTTGRSDWETISTFYPMISDMGGNPGPSTLPLELTQVTFVDSVSDTTTLPARYFDLRDAQSSALLPLPQALGYLFKTRGSSDLTDDIVVALGATGANGDRIKVRGAEVGDRLCLFDSSSSRVGCETVTEFNVSISLSEVLSFNPSILVTPVSSRTFAITVTQFISSGVLNVQVLPAYGSPVTPTLISAPWDEMIPIDAANPLTFTQVITLPYPAFEGFVRVWVPGSTPERSAMSQFFLSSAWAARSRGGKGDIRPWDANTRAWGSNTRAWGAPVASGDGQVTIFNAADPFGETGTSALQALTTLSNLPAWLTLVGQGYRVSLLESSNVTRTISFDYLQRDVPDGYEHTLTIYYSPNDGQSWQRLPTEVEQEENLAATQMPTDGEGIYALISTIAMPAFTRGWNQFGYTVPHTRTVQSSLASIEDYYTSIYFDDPPTNQWLLHDETVVDNHAEFAELVNDLTELEFGQSYWLYATEAITLYLGVPSDNLVPSRAPSYGLPPATFYGPISPAVAPTVGMTITATINGAVCGQSTVDELNGQLVYKIQVAADTGNDCGVDNATITFKVGNWVMTHNHSWDNSQAWYHPLMTADMTAPILTVPADMTVAATSPVGAVVTFTVTVTDTIDPNPTVLCTPPSGSTFPLGTTTVTCIASDASGNSAEDSFELTIRASDFRIYLPMIKNGYLHKVPIWVSIREKREKREWSKEERSGSASC